MGSVRVALAMLAAILLLPGCRGQGPLIFGSFGDSASAPAAVYQHTIVEDDEAVGVTVVEGPLAYEPFVLDAEKYLVRALVPLGDKPPAGQYQVYIRADVDRWIYLGQAYSHGEALETVLIDREAVRCSSTTKEICSRTEKLAVTVSYQQLQAFAETGFDFKVLGRRDSRSFSIPAGYFRGFLLRLDELKAARAA